MSDMFRDRTYIVTGAASGIGRATAQHLHRRGARLSLWDRDAAGLAALADDLSAHTQIVDVTNAEAVAAAASTTEAHFGALHGVIHCAGILYTGLFEQMPLDEHTRLVGVNLTGTLNVVHHAIPHLKQTGGSLILLGSVSGFIPTPEFATYAATKAAVYSLAQSLRIELDGTGIHLGIANPLFVQTPMLDERVRRTRSVNSRSAFVRIYTPNDIAQSLIRGIERRQFMIWNGQRARIIYWLSRYAAWSAHALASFTWRRL